MTTGFTPVITVEDSILDVSSLLVEQVPKRGRGGAEDAVVLTRPAGLRPALGAVLSHAKGSRGDLVMVRGDFSPISVRSSGTATTGANLMIMEAESQLEQELAAAAAQKAKATAARLALLKAQAEGSQGGGSRCGSRMVQRVATDAPPNVDDMIPIQPIPTEPNVDRDLSEMLDDDFDARVNLRQTAGRARFQRAPGHGADSPERISRGTR